MIAEFTSEEPKQIALIGISGKPADGVELSPAVHAALEPAIDAALRQLEDWNIDVRLKAEATLPEVWWEPVAARA
jgi:Ni,Fe-hydrogenase maturation factor